MSVVKNMKKHTKLLGISIVILMALFTVSSFASTYVRAALTSSRVVVNGTTITFEAYNINEYNYFKLRDLAMALNGSSKQFEVIWNKTNNEIDLLPGQAYTPVGGELTKSGNKSEVNAALAHTKILLNGKERSLTTYNIGGYNYYKLRDLGGLIGFGVTWNKTQNKITIDSSKTYGESFYVSTEGDDYANPGTIDRPWGTIQKAANSVEPGDTVYIRGGTYHEIVDLQVSGTSKSYITFTSYPGETAIIDGTGLGGYYQCLFNVNAQSYIVVKNLSITNASGQGIGYSINKYGTHDIIIQNCSTSKTQNSGIHFYHSNNIVIDGVSVDKANLGHEQEGITLADVDNFEIKNCTLNNLHMEGIDAKTGCKNGKIHDNIVENSIMDGENSGVGIYVDAAGYDSSNIEIYNNKVKNTHQGIVLASETGGTLTNISIHDNIADDCKYTGLEIAGWAYGRSHPMDKIKFYHNTVSGATSIGIVLNNPDATNVTITNNIFNGDGSSIPIVVDGGNIKSTTIDGNSLNRVISGQSRYPTGTNYILLP